ncbi:unnamed protein product [Adineta steineri]|uniref:NHL repeat containing protein n=1 Tax=Adineta steineri TaxID=433720 RepID=A0A814PNA0_9BILA|nr:unnamed protein product [Adineta steineri]
MGPKPRDIFINTNNTIYVTSQAANRIIVWSEGNTIPIKNISGDLSNPFSLFVTTAGEIYVDSDNSTGRIDKWTLNSTIGIPIMYTCAKCYDVFIDMNNNLYCSMSSSQQVVTKSLDVVSNALTIVAGTGTAGNTSYMLNSPAGIYVNTNFDLYVADYLNNRVQLFQSGQLNGITVAGAESLNPTITLKHPIGIVLDGDNYLYIVDSGNYRVVGSGPNGFRCLVGCSDSNGSATNQLTNPKMLSFDSYGNMYITDYSNDRIQKFALLTNLCTISYNKLKFCSNASWYANATTFANMSMMGPRPHDIFINTNNTIYVTSQTANGILVWSEGDTTPIKNISGNLSNPFGLFVTTAGEIYVDSGNSTGRIDEWTLNATVGIPIMYTCTKCYGVSIDTNNNLYCSMYKFHQIVTKSLDIVSNALTIVAGTGTAGNTSSMLNTPAGIYINTNFDLYVADYNNDRIQLFPSGELNGITVAGTGSLNTTITLNAPSGIVLDADNYLYIVDSGNHRVVGSGPNGFRCLVGCSNSSGSAANQLTNPKMLSFDSYGNMYITDYSNDRIQKFALLTNLCSKSTEIKICLRYKCIA